MSAFLTILRDGTTSPRVGLESPEWIKAPDATLPEAAIGAEGGVLVEELIACLDRDESYREFRPLLALTGRDLVQSGCASLYGFADRRRQIGVVSTFRLGHPNPALVQARLENVIRHEIGHLAGWNHCRQPGCLMHPARKPEDLDSRKAEPCLQCSHHRSTLTTLLHRIGAALLLLFIFAGVNFAATLLKPAPMAPFTTDVDSSEFLIFNGAPLEFSSSLVDSASAQAELNRLFLMLDPPSLSIRTHSSNEAAILSGTREVLRIRHDQPEEEATNLAALLNGLLEAKGSRSSLCAECHLERKPEVLEAAYGRKWGIGPF